MTKIKRDSPPIHEVVVDTNILWDKNKKNAASPEFDLFWKSSLSLIPLQLRVPEVVFGELHFQQTTSANKLCSIVKEGLIELSGIAEFNYAPKVEEQKVKVQVGQKINKWLKALGGTVVTTPFGLINWSELIENAIWRKPPFTFDPKEKDSEKGFRDALILETVVSIAKSSNSKNHTTIFLSNDFLLRTTAEARLKGDKTFLAFESISDFQSYIQLTQQELTDKFVKSIQGRARTKFYTVNDRESLYLKEDLRQQIRNKFNDDLDVLPTSTGVSALARLIDPASAQTLKKVAEKWWVNATQFELLVGDREFHWSTKVTVAQLYEGISPGVGGLLATALPPESKIKLAEFNVKWTANVKTDGRFHDTTVLSISKNPYKVEPTTEESTSRWKLEKQAASTL